MAKKILTLNIGSSTVTLAEYAENSGSLKLINYGIAPLAAPIDAGNAETILVPAIMDVMREKGIKPGKVALSVSGQMAFQRFAAIPDVGGSDKFEQSIRFEIEQNVPFPIDEMVCDRQVLGDTPDGDKSVMIVAAKVAQIEEITSAVQAAGFDPEVVDIAPIALTNAVKSFADATQECSMILDIGARTTSLVIVDDEKLYMRSIPVSGGTITKEIAQAFGCSMEEAEIVKREKAYVSVGGVTEDEDPTVDKISKICRTVMTRLQAEVTRSVNFYRSQQNGRSPVKMYLAGGSSLIPGIDDFLAESLHIEVEYFNPFSAVGVGGSVDVEQLGSEGIVIAGTVGLALHVAKKSYYSVNLLPPSIIESHADKMRIPFVASAVVALLAALAMVFVSLNNDCEVLEAKCDALSGDSSKLKNIERGIVSALELETKAKAQADEFADLLAKRDLTVRSIGAIRDALGPGLWIEKWEDSKVTIRGWKEDIENFTSRYAQTHDGKTLQASEIIAARLRSNINVVSNSVKIVGSSQVKELLWQIEMGVQFK
jgi:type IV pilus assembly protein PilM